MEIDVPSHDDLGLQLADVVAGEVRECFRNNQESLTDGTTLRLITPESDEPLQNFMKITDSFMKIGALSPMSVLLPGACGWNSVVRDYYGPISSLRNTDTALF
jgi:hypothetical protein